MDVRIPALRAMISLVSGNEHQTQEMIDAGAISALQKLCQKYHRSTPLPGVVLIVLARLLIFRNAVKVKLFNSMKISLLMKTVVSDEYWNILARRACPARNWQ